MTATLYHGDCLDVMATLPPASIDTCISDPPYGLDFMGKEWDHGVPGPAYWSALMRVLRPGAMVLAFGGTRTHHRLMVAMEDAGLIIRDVVMWVYGEGFPKSHNLSIAIDKRLGAMGHRGKAHSAYATGNDFQGRDLDSPKIVEKHTGITDLAKMWSGWGTALKPAWEPIIVAMNPMPGSFADNALDYGVAGMWIDGTRVGDDLVPQGRAGRVAPKFSGVTMNSYGGQDYPLPDATGRWPANLAHDGSPDVLAQFPGESARFFYCPKASRKERDAGLDQFETGSAGVLTGRQDGSMAGQPKAKNTHPTVKPIELMRYLTRLTSNPRGGSIIDPFCGSGSGGIAAVLEGREFIGIEKDIQSIQTAWTRIGYWSSQARQGQLL